MAIAYYIGLDALLLFNTTVTKNCAISSDNRTFSELLKYTGFPSLEEIANQDAFCLIQQWQILNPEFFEKGSDRVSELREQQNKTIWSGVKPEFYGTCLEEWMNMARKYQNDNMKKTRRR